MHLLQAELWERFVIRFYGAIDNFVFYSVVLYYTLLAGILFYAHSLNAFFAILQQSSNETWSNAKQCQVTPRSTGKVRATFANRNGFNWQVTQAQILHLYHCFFDNRNVCIDRNSPLDSRVLS